MEAKCHVTRRVLQQILDAARECPSRECCGLLAGGHNVINAVFPATNALESASAYEIAPQELFDIFREIRAQNLEFVGIYHSHPHSENVPSVTDIARAYYPDAIYFIVSPRADTARPIRAFRIRDSLVNEFQIEEVFDSRR